MQSKSGFINRGLIREEENMAVSYNGLWKLLIDKNMKKMDLVEKIGISSSTLAKMSKGEAVSMTIMEKICEELNCDFGDIINYERKGDGQDGV
jgi:DNA-binding Xre family transcriptional regulator